MKSRVVVYTTIFNNYDALNDPPIFYKDVDYVCFTDSKKIKSNNWKIIYLKIKKKNSPKKNREIKINYFKFLPHYEYSIYHDANVILFSNPLALIKKYLKSKDIAMPQHRYRNSTLSEGMYILKHLDLPKINNQKINKIISKPINWLTENRVILRRHHKNQIEKLMKIWWKMYNSGIIRDQVSFPYACKKIKLKPKIIKKKFNFLHLFIVKPHINSSLRFKIKYYSFLIFFEKILFYFNKIKNYEHSKK